MRQYALRLGTNYYNIVYQIVLWSWLQIAGKPAKPQPPASNCCKQQLQARDASKRAERQPPSCCQLPVTPPSVSSGLLLRGLKLEASGSDTGQASLP
jgi:hypothetical protein